MFRLKQQHHFWFCICSDFPESDEDWPDEEVERSDICDNEEIKKENITESKIESKGEQIL